MDNGINLRQNEDRSIMMLAAQRQLYSDAKCLNNLAVVLSVLIPFGMSFVLLFVSEDSPLGIASYIVSIVSAIIAFIVDGAINRKRELAASIQQGFDIYVYAMPWDSRLFGNENTHNNEIAAYSKKIMNNPKNKAELYNWYSPAIEGKPLLEAILTCQRENVWWDTGLRKRFKTASIIIVVAMCAIVFGIGIGQDENVTKLLWRFAFVAPMIEWLLGTIAQINEDVRTLNELDNNVRAKSTRTMEELQDIQKMLFDHRKKCFPIPNIVYAIFKNNDEDNAHRTAQMDD